MDVHIKAMRGTNMDVVNTVYKSHEQISCTTSAEDFAELQQAEFVWGTKLKIKGEYWRAS